MSKELFIKIGLSLPKDSDEEFTQKEIDQLTLDYIKEFNSNPDIKADVKMSFSDIEAQQLLELKSENEKLKGKYEYNLEQLDISNNNNKRLQNKCNKLEQQLKEKDEEIEKYQKDINDICNKFMVCSLNEIYKKYIDMCNEVVRLTEENSKLCKTNTHQVCEKIRNNCWCGGALLEDNYYKVPVKFLEQIEKGENK